MRAQVRRRGSVLVAVVAMVLVLVSLVAAGLIQARQGFDDAIFDSRSRQLRFGAQSGLETARSWIDASTYDSRGNAWLRDKAAALPTAAITPALLEARTPALEFPLSQGTRSIRVKVFVFNSAGTFRIVSLARDPQSQDLDLLAQNVRERQPFSKYLFFNDIEGITFGTTTVRGDVHSNDAITFLYAGFESYGTLSANRGFVYYGDTYRGYAKRSDVSFYGPTNSSAPKIPMPEAAKVLELKDKVPATEGHFRITNEASGYWRQAGFNKVQDVGIQFVGSNVQLTVNGTRQQGNKSVAHTMTRVFPMPVGGVIYSSGTVSSLAGELTGRVTVTSEGEVKITDSLRYKDSQGEPAYILTRNGQEVANPAGVTQAWTSASGYEYVANPDYDGETGSALGIVAVDDVSIVDSAPDNIEVHAAVYSSEGNFHSDLGKKKGNQRILGSITARRRGWRYNSSGYGYAKSGEYIYDEALRSRPPPHFMSVDKASFGERYRVVSGRSGQETSS